MADGMAEIEHRAIIFFALVSFDDARFDGARCDDDLGEQLTVSLDELFHILLQQMKKIWVLDDAVFDDLRKPCHQLAAR
jgi:hypothetical protein